MRRYAYLIGLIILVLTSRSSAEITVPEGFVVDTLLNQIDGQTPRLEVIHNPDYGFGVVAASMDNGILKVLRISQSSVDMLTTKSGFPIDSAVGSIKFDTTGLFANKLHIAVWTIPRDDAPGFYDSTQIFEVTHDGTTNEVASYGNSSNQLMFIFAFTNGAAGYLPGAYLEDLNGWYGVGHGTSLYHLDEIYNSTELAANCEPLGRTDIDIQAMQFDPTGSYSFYLTMLDDDRNNDNISVIYQLLPDLSWVELTPPVNTSSRMYRDLSFSSSGAFGEALYITDRITETVMTVEPNGVHTVFASGFTGIEAITVSEDGEHMFISDENGVHQIRAETTQVGPQIVMREPWVDNDDVHTGESGIDSLRLLWSERVIFENTDVNVVDEDGNDVQFSVSGSNSEFLIVAFGETLLHDKYTITISDSVHSVETGAAIDGDNDGIAGGNAIVMMEHRKRSDFDNDNDVDFIDFANFAMNWLWHE